MLILIQAPKTSPIYGPFNILFRFFPFPIYVSFNKAFAKNFTKKLSFFNTNFEHLFQDVILLQNIRMSNLVILNWQPFE